MQKKKSNILQLINIKSEIMIQKTFMARDK